MKRGVSENYKKIANMNGAADVMAADAINARKWNLGNFQMLLKGYVSVRDCVPVSVQNLVVRDYCARNGHQYFLSDVEFVTPGYPMWEGLMDNLDSFDGVVCYSMWQMPEDFEMPEGKEIHCALEGYIFPRDQEMMHILWELREATK